MALRFPAPPPCSPADSFFRVLRSTPNTGTHTLSKRTEPIASGGASAFHHLPNPSVSLRIMEHRRLLPAACRTRQRPPQPHPRRPAPSTRHHLPPRSQSDVRAALLANNRVRAGWLVKGAEDLTAWDGVPFATITLLSKARFASSDLDSQKELEGEGKFMLGPTTRVPLPSKYGRDGLSVDIIPPSPSTTPGTGTHFRLINVHLDSLWHTFPNRAQQLKILASLLREPGCAGGVIAGDFNAISPADDGLVEENGLVDAWVALHGHGQGQGHGHGKDGEGDGATWGVGVERERHDGLGPGRLDKVAMTMNGVKAEEIEVLRPGLIEVPRPGEGSVHVPWSDHLPRLLGQNIQVVHPVVETHDDLMNRIFTKDDDNLGNVDDMGSYQHLEWLERRRVIGNIRAFVPYVGYISIAIRNFTNLVCNENR
ncbi:hypothetical protein BD410DRAFT_832351, partial [Rickenella mellea]